MSTTQKAESVAPKSAHHFRFHLPHAHLHTAFGPDWFGGKAEQFARFFGTPKFLVAQTFLVAVWIVANAVGWATFDLYPFILLNLAFSTQAAYAAPLILLAQTRQADRDKAHSEADAQHREALATAHAERQKYAEEQTKRLLELLETNTELTKSVQELAGRIEALTAEVHRRVAAPKEA